MPCGLEHKLEHINAPYGGVHTFVHIDRGVTPLCRGIRCALLYRVQQFFRNAHNGATQLSSLADTFVTFVLVVGIGMGALCSCCTTGMTGDEEDGLLGDANSARSDEARRKAAEAALRRAGALAQRARPPPRSSSSNTRPSSVSNNMRWEGG